MSDRLGKKGEKSKRGTNRYMDHMRWPKPYLRSPEETVRIVLF